MQGYMEHDHEKANKKVQSIWVKQNSGAFRQNFNGFRKISELHFKLKLDDFRTL